MSLFKTTDEKLEKLGFTKEEENKFGAIYSRKDEQFGYIQEVALLHKANGNHIMQSYDRTAECSNVVGLTYKEMKLFTKKMKELRLC